MGKRIFNLVKENKSFIVFIVLMSIFRSAVADWNNVPTGSMKPTIIEGDRILINKMAYDVRIPFTHYSLKKLADPRFGDIVIFDSAASDKRLVKRVIGLPGDIVEMNDNQLTINGEPLQYQAIQTNQTALDITQNEHDFIERRGKQAYKIRLNKRATQYSSFAPVKVPENYFLVLGDNRDNSADSRFIGFVPRSEIIGKSDYVVMSLNYDNYYIPRTERFLQSL